MGHPGHATPVGSPSPVALGCHDMGGLSATVRSHTGLKFSYFQKLVEPTDPLWCGAIIKATFSWGSRLGNGCFSNNPVNLLDTGHGW